jgi:hypothetical protein
VSGEKICRRFKWKSAKIAATCSDRPRLVRIARQPRPEGFLSQEASTPPSTWGGPRGVGRRPQS